MSDFPDLPEPHFPIKERTIYPDYKSPMDAPYVHIRKRYTGMMKAFSFEWDQKVALPEVSYQRLEAHFYKNKGSSFNWTHPATGKVYSVYYDQDDLEGDSFVVGYRTTSVSLRTATYVTATTTTTSTTTSSTSTTTTTE